MSTFEQLFGWAILAGAVAMAGAMVRTALRGWALDEDGKVHHRRDAPGRFLTMQAFQLASVVVLVVVGIKVLNHWQ